jgi:uncharacterized protein (TIGR03435 family)
MKMMALLGAVLMAGMGIAAQAQDISGTWQGTLHAGKDLRIIVKVTSDDGLLKGAMYSIDQGGQPIALSSVSLQGITFTFGVDSINGTYEGKLSADSKTIVGIWTQSSHPLPLTLERASKDSAWDIPAPPKRMAEDADPSFDVATIKPSKPGQDGKGFQLRGRTVMTFNTSLADLIEFAYDVHVKQIVGGPDWIDKDKFDITAVPDKPGEPSYNQEKAMVQKLLADRFQLTFHHEKKELSVYVLTAEKGGPKNVTKSASTQDGFSIPIGPAPGGIKLSVRNGTMTNFAVFGLQGAVLDRPVLDQTGITDRLDFALTWTPDDSQFGGHIRVPPSDNAAPGLFTAIQEQLGLKLEAVRAPADVMVIDRAEAPSAN